MIKYPVFNEEYSTDESIDHFITRLKRVTDKYQKERFLNKKNVDFSKMYYGKVNTSDFQITRYITYGNSMNPEIVGVLKNDGEKTIISIRFQIKKDIKKLSLGLALFSFFALIFSIAIDINNIVNGKFSVVFLAPLLLLICSVLIVKFGFKFEIENAKDDISKFIYYEHLNG